MIYDLLFSYITGSIYDTPAPVLSQSTPLISAAFIIACVTEMHSSLHTGSYTLKRSSWKEENPPFQKFLELKKK